MGKNIIQKGVPLNFARFMVRLTAIYQWAIALVIGFQGLVILGLGFLDLSKLLEWDARLQFIAPIISMAGWAGWIMVTTGIILAMVAYMLWQRQRWAGYVIGTLSAIGFLTSLAVGNWVKMLIMGFVAYLLLYDKGMRKVLR